MGVPERHTDPRADGESGVLRRLESLAATIRDRRLVLFDLDDTLCDYTLARGRRLERAFGDAFDASGHPQPPDMADLIARSIAINPHGVDHFPELLAGFGLPDSAVSAGQRWYQTNRFHELALFAEARAALAAVRAQSGAVGRRVGVITNGPADVQRAKVELLGVEALVDFVIISGEFGVHKPDPAIFREALRLGDVPAHETVYIGDSAEHDVVGARAAGLAVVWVNRDGGPWAGPGDQPASEIRNVAEIAQALTKPDERWHGSVSGAGQVRPTGYT